MNIGSTFTVTATAGAGGGISPSGAQTLNAGSSQSFTITPSTGYHIADVLVDGSSVGAVTSYQFTSLGANHTIAASFAADQVVTYTVTATAGAGGGISPSGAQTLNAGSSASFAITPNSGYHIADVLVDGSSVEAVTSYEFDNLGADHTIAASFAVNTFTVTATAGSGGGISPSGAQTMNAGSSQSFTITPSTGYHIADVLVDGSSVGAVTSYEFDNLGADHTIAASFAADPVVTYTVTATAGSGGGISPSGVQTLNAGSSQSFTITPNSGYHIADVLVDGSSVEAVTSYEFDNLSADHTIAASFAADPVVTYTVTASAGAGGNISPAGAQTLNAGSSQSFTITANTGYHIADVLVDGSSVGPVTSYEFDNLGADHTIAASFAADPVAVLAVTSPNGGESLPAGIPVTVTWSSPSVTTGVFAVWAVSQTTTYSLGTVNANGGSAYAASWNVNVPTGNYRIRVSYGLTAGTYTTTDYSDAAFAVTPGVTVTSPNGGESLPAGIPVTVTWSSPPVASGVFTVWALSQGGTYYNIGTVNANGGTAYSATWTANAPPGSYRLRVSYGVTAGTTYTITDYSDAYFTVTPGATVTWPNGGESLPANVPVTVTWSSPPVASGVFTVWALSQGGTYYNIGTVNANGSVSYGKVWNVKAPAGSYRIRVSYGVTAGTTYTITDYSDAYFTVTTS